MAYIMDSADMARQYSISRTAGDLMVKLEKLMYSSIKNGVQDRNGYYVYASHRVLADKIGKSESTVERAIRELKRAGLIWIRRTKHNGHIYFYDKSASCKNDKSYSDNLISYKTKESYLNKVQEINKRHAENSMDGKQISVESRENLHSEDMKKCRPTPKRPRITKQQRNENRQKIKDMLAKKWDIAGELMVCADGDTANYDSLSQLADIVADTVSAGAHIAVRGRYLSAAEYWQAIKNMRPQGLLDLLERIQDRYISAGVRDLRGYTLSALYGEAEYQRLTAGAWCV